MSEDVRAETPRPPESIYEGRGEDVDAFRPVFTGDVFGLPEPNSRPVIVLQHPCALRSDGVELVPRVLIAKLRPAREVLGREKIRRDWHEESLRVMPLPNLLEDGEHWVADFREVDTVPGPQLQSGTDRLAIFSLTGVNLLLQRWVRHNSRVLVPTMTLAEVVTGPYEEADLAAAWSFELQEVAPSGPTHLHDFAAWITGPAFSGDRTSRQQLLEQPQARPSVRRSMSQEVRERLAAELD